MAPAKCVHGFLFMDCNVCERNRAIAAAEERGIRRALEAVERTPIAVQAERDLAPLVSECISRVRAQIAYKLRALLGERKGEATLEHPCVAYQSPPGRCTEREPCPHCKSVNKRPSQPTPTGPSGEAYEVCEFEEPRHADCTPERCLRRGQP